MLGRNNLCFLSWFFYVFLCYSEAAVESVNPGTVIKNVDRSIDISTQLVEITNKLTIENNNKMGVNSILFTIEPQLKDKVAFISAQISDSSKTSLKLSETKIQGDSENYFWKIDLRETLQPGKTVTIEVECVLSKVLTPFPTTITQKEKQLVQYKANHLFYSPYKVSKQMTTINLGTRNVESYTKLNPVSQTDTVITYGPYQDQGPFAQDSMLIHYENNSPFLTVTNLERTIEVSHWGVISVEEVVDLIHTGAILKGPFSRYEFQRETQSGVSSVKSFKTVLPAAATDAYYRDEIGNISTSHMRVLSDSVELDLRPRFPLFGGWKTHYVLGYNVPSYEYLYNSGDEYKLKMRLIDHVFDDMIMDEVVIKIILPEGAHDIQLSTPYMVQRLQDSLHFTYLDTKGRPVISIKKNNLVENHIQDFELSYTFPRILMLQEPLLVIFAFYLLFLLVVIYVRLDLSISKDESTENRMRVSGLCDKILMHQDKRAATYNHLDDLLSKLKSNKDVNSFLAAVKTITQEYKAEATHIGEILAKLKPDSPEIADKVTELQKLDKSLKELYATQQSLYVDKLMTNKIARGPFVEAENSLNKKKEELVEKINNILKNLH